MKSKVQMTTKDRNRGTQVYEQSEIEQDTEGSPESGLRSGLGGQYG